LPSARRLDLISRFLPHAQYLDIELRSAEAWHSWLNLPPAKAVRRIISLHDFDSTPSPRSLHAKARAAKSHGADIFKVATRTETAAQLARLFEFVANQEIELPVSAMGNSVLSRAWLWPAAVQFWLTLRWPIGRSMGSCRSKKFALRSRSSRYINDRRAHRESEPACCSLHADILGAGHGSLCNFARTNSRDAPARRPAFPARPSPALYF